MYLISVPVFIPLQIHDNLFSDVTSDPLLVQPFVQELLVQDALGVLVRELLRDLADVDGGEDLQHLLASLEDVFGHRPDGVGVDDDDFFDVTRILENFETIFLIFVLSFSKSINYHETHQHGSPGSH